MASTGRGADRAAPGAHVEAARGLGIGGTYPTHVIEKPGLPRAVVVEMPHTHSAIVEVFVRAGSAYETRELNGVSHLIEHVVLAGTRRFPTRAQLQRAIDATGGFLDAVTHKELTEFTFQVLPDRVARAIELLGEALAHASFSEEAVESERQIVLEEMLTGNYEGAKDPFTELLWGTDSVGLPIIGTREVIERVTPAELREFWQRTYTTEGVLVCVAGNVRPEVVEAALESFRGLPEGSAGARVPARARPQQRPEFYVDRYRSGAIDTCLMLRTPGWDTADRSLHTILYLVTQYYQTHVYEELIGPELPVYYLYTGQETFITEGYIYFYFNVSRDRFFPTLDRVVTEIDRMRSGGIGAEELEVNKRRFALSVLANLDDPRDVAYRVGSDLLLSGWDRAVSIEEELRQIEAVTPADVLGRMEPLFQARNLCVVSRGHMSWWKKRRLERQLERWLP